RRWPRICHVNTQRMIRSPTQVRKHAPPRDRAAVHRWPRDGIPPWGTGRPDARIVRSGRRTTHRDGQGRLLEAPPGRNANDLPAPHPSRGDLELLRGFKLPGRVTDGNRLVTLARSSLIPQWRALTLGSEE